MRFAHVIGMLHALPKGGYRFQVTLDTRTSVETIRNETVAHLMRHHGAPDESWTVDQLTQETIGTTLAERGWEAVSLASGDPEAQDGPPVVVYLVRIV